MTSSKRKSGQDCEAGPSQRHTKVVIEDIRGSGVETLAGIAKVLEARGVRTLAGRSTFVDRRSVAFKRMRA